MSIAEKLTTIAENEQKVFDAGKGAGRKAERDVFWDSYQQNGNRTFYQSAFAYQWTSACFKPKYDIRPTNAIQMFTNTNITDVQACLDEVGVVLDLSQATSCRYLISSSAVTRLGVVDTTGLASLDGIFANGQKLHTIELLRLKNDGSQIQGTYAPFTSCSALKNIKVQGKFGFTFSMEWCPLTKDSIEQVIFALHPSATGKTLTLKLSAVKKAFETSEGANDGNTSESWLALSALAPNWTITLV